MPSPADIPEELLQRERWDDFARWLNDLHIPPPDRKKLGSYWAAFVDIRLTREQWRDIVPEGW